MYVALSNICHIRFEDGTGAETCPAIASGMVTCDAPISYWTIFSFYLVTVPEVFPKVNLSQVARSEIKCSNQIERKRERVLANRPGYFVFKTDSLSKLLKPLSRK